ncbi:hypothetical protein Tco_1307044 [Tanacetum coccineum]
MDKHGVASQEAILFLVIPSHIACSIPDFIRPYGMSGDLGTTMVGESLRSCALKSDCGHTIISGVTISFFGSVVGHRNVPRGSHLTSYEDIRQLLGPETHRGITCFAQVLN